MQQRGFTLLEVLAALAITAGALVVLLGRLGAAADIQRDLALHALALEVAVNELERDRLLAVLPSEERQGEVEVEGVQLSWKKRVKPTAVKDFVRQDIAVSAAGETAVELFLYRVGRF